MKLLFAKTFKFSASHEKNGKVYGHNYLLTITTDMMDEARQDLFETRVEEGLISQVHTKDLGTHVSFLKGMDISGENLLRAFAKIAEGLVHPAKIYALSLERDSLTKVTLTL